MKYDVMSDRELLIRIDERQTALIGRFERYEEQCDKRFEDMQRDLNRKVSKKTLTWSLGLVGSVSSIVASAMIFLLKFMYSK